jgi:hypothetical protein
MWFATLLDILASNLEAKETTMLNLKKIAALVAVLIVGCFAALTGFRNAAQAEEGKPAHEVYQAQARGTETQLGKLFDVNINIDSYSSDADQQALNDAFQKGGSKGLSSALEKMSRKGSLAVTGTVGYDITYARRFSTPDGYRVRILTNRPVSFRELRNGARSENYNLSYVELNINDQPSKSTGMLLPAVQFTVDKKTKEIVAEDYRNPWKLQNIRRSSN